MSEFLEDRRKSLEDEFFHKQNQEKLAKIKAKLDKSSSVAALKKASGLDDEDVLARLVEIGVNSETLSALSLVPLVAVAWADGSVQENERAAILHGAKGKGIEPGSTTYELIEGWLGKRPGDSLLEAWEGYIATLRDELTHEQTKILGNQVTAFARSVAESAGGFLGLATISSKEEQVLERIGQAFA